MKVNATLTETREIIGFVVFLIITPSSIIDIFKNNPATILFKIAIPAPIGPGIEIPLTTPDLPTDKPFYGILIGESLSGNLSDMKPITASAWAGSLNATSDEYNTPGIYQNHPFLPLYAPGIFPPGKIAGYRISWP